MSQQPLMPLVALYEAILTALGCTVNDNLVSLETPDGALPVIMDKRRLVLPSTEILRASRWTDWIAFHPLSESIARGESLVLRNTRLLVNNRLSGVLCGVLQDLLAVAVDTSRHEQLEPGQLKLLTAIPNVTPKTFKLLTDIVDKASNDNAKFVNVYLKRGAQLGGVSCTRAAIVTFPVLEALTTDGPIYGIQATKKDRLALQALFTWVLPDANVADTYSRGSTSQTAPYFDALMRAFEAVMARLNAVIWKFRKYIDNFDQLRAELSWINMLDRLTEYKGHIPVLQGNDGEGGVDTPQQGGFLLPAVVTPLPTPLQPMMGGLPSAIPTPTTIKPIGAASSLPPLGAPASALSGKDEGNDWSAVVASKTMLRPMGPMFPVAGMPMPQQPMMPYQQPQAMYPVAGMPMPQQGYPQQGYPQQGMMPGYPQQPMMQQTFPAVGMPYQQPMQQPMQPQMQPSPTGGRI